MTPERKPPTERWTPADDARLNALIDSPEGQREAVLAFNAGVAQSVRRHTGRTLREVLKTAYAKPEQR